MLDETEIGAKNIEDFQAQLNKVSGIFVLLSKEFLGSVIFDQDHRRVLYQRIDEAAYVLPLVVETCAWKKYRHIKQLAVPQEGPLSKLASDDASSILIDEIIKLLDFVNRPFFSKALTQ